jgi:hypothetical protein
MSAGEAAPPARRGLELALLAAALLVTTGLLARLPGPFPDLSRFQPMFAAAFGCYALALNRMRRYEDLPFVGAVVIAVRPSSPTICTVISGRAACSPTV